MLGEDRIQQVQAEWEELIQQAQTEMTNGTDPASESVQALARRWLELIQEFTGGDPGIEKSLNTMYREEGTEVASRGAVNSAVMEYMSTAMSSLNQPE
jgi:MerR family transcriptional regulator, thiopeptide resistance regulator